MDAKADFFKTLSAITAGILLVVAGVYFFKFPNNFSIGGISGLSIILHALFPAVSAATFMLGLNLLLLLLGLIILGRSFGLKTIYSTLLLSFSLELLQRFYPLTHPLTDQPLLELSFAVLLPAVGSAILFNLDASSGGTDIVAMILKKYTDMHIGHALLLSDLLITLLCFAVFDIKTGLLAVLGLVLKTTVIDTVIENLNLYKSFMVVTTQAPKICAYINQNLKRGATIAHGQGAFTGEERSIIFTMMTRRQAILLQRYIKREDLKAFISITNTSSIIGKGFRDSNL